MMKDIQCGATCKEFIFQNGVQRDAGIDTRGYYMNGNTAKKIEVQAENTARKMSNMHPKSGISRILHGHSVYLELQLEQGCSFTD